MKYVRKGRRAELAALFARELDRGCAAARAGQHSRRGEVSEEVGTGFRDGRPGAGMEFGGPDCGGGCRLRRRNRVSRRAGEAKFALCRGSAIDYWYLDGTASTAKVETEADGTPTHCTALRETAAS